DAATPGAPAGAQVAGEASGDRPPAESAGAGRRRAFGFGPAANTLLAYTLVKGLQLSLHLLIFPLYAYSLGYDQAAIGRLNATGPLTVFLVGVPPDRVGRARLFAICALLTPPALTGLALARSYPALIAWIVVLNIVGTVYWSALSPLLVGAVPEDQRVRAFSVNTFFIFGVGA